MIKIAMIGAGSVVFSKNLTGDILSNPLFRDATFAYMDIDPERLEVGANLCRKLARALGAEPKIEATLDRRQALAGADFVINMVQIGGWDSTLVDFEIPRKYGLNFTIADTTGPGGLFRALRTYPMLKGLCQDMMEICPSAILLNYSNPMSMNMQTISRTSAVRAVGLCHSVQGTFNQLMGYLGEKSEEANFICAGINHMAFYLRLEKNGQDLYPRLFEAMNDPHVYDSNRVRFELMKRLGYYVTESSEHNAEYNPYFIPHGKEMIERYSVPIDELLRRCESTVDEFHRLKAACQSDEPVKFRRSHEYGSVIINSVVTGQPSVVYGNMPNAGAIGNLPPTTIVEVPTLVDRSGLQFTRVGELPPQLVAYIQPHISQHELFIRAAMEGRRDHVYQAAMFDPLTAAVLTMDQIVQMCDELIAAHGDLLPKLSARTLVPGSGKNFPPVDPGEFRKSWLAAQSKANEGIILDWQVIGPFAGEGPKKISLDLKTPVESDFENRADGSVDLKADYRLNGSVLTWRPARAEPKKGFVNFDETLGRHEWSVAYGYAEIEDIHGRETLLRCGSDDGIRVWLNGKLIHSHEIQRGYKAGSDEAPIYLQPGINRILVKVDNHIGGWGFGVLIPKASF